MRGFSGVWRAAWLPAGEARAVIRPRPGRTPTRATQPSMLSVFSTLLGSGCGTELTSDIFSANPAVWLGVTVAADAEALPRVQIATVAYSLNSETLQGYPASSSATINTVPVINNAGQMVLAATSPLIQSTSGTFGIQGQAITLSSTSGSNGNITISPDGTGSANFIFSGASPGGGTGMLNATDANLTSGSLIYGAVANNSSTYNLLQLQSGSSLTNKFLIDYAGNVTAAGTASISGNLTLAGGARSIQTTTDSNLTLGGSTTGNIVLSPSNDIAGGNVSPHVTNMTDLGTSSLLFRNIYGTTIYQGVNQVCDSSGLITGCGGINYWALGNGALYPTNNTVDVLFGATAGATATSSAKFAFTGIKTGTPTASIAGTSNLASLFMDGNGNISSTNRNNMTLGNSATYNTTGNVLINPNGTGNVGIGDTAPAYKLSVVGTMTDTSGTGNQLTNNVLYVNAPSTSSQGFYTNYNYLNIQNSATNYTSSNNAAMFNYAYNNSTGTVTSLEGVRNRVENANSGTVSSVFGTYSNLSNSGSGTMSNAYAEFIALANSGVVGTNFGVYINDPSGAGTIGTSYGVYMENQNKASTNYALFTNTGLNQLGDQLKIVGSADRQQLIVKGNATQTSNLAEFQNSGSTVVTRAIIRLALALLERSMPVRAQKYKKYFDAS